MLWLANDGYGRTLRACKKKIKRIILLQCITYTQKKPLKNITVKDDGNGVNGKIVSATFIYSNYENYLLVCAEYATAILEKCSSFSLSTNFTQEQQ